MKIYLHVGPHKTGTTSVQKWMLNQRRQFLDSHQIYYPEPPEEGPGHALLAWDVLGIHGRDIDPLLLGKVIEDARRRDASRVFLSSEEFCIGLVEGTLENLAELNEYGQLELIVTLTPLVDRFLAEVSNLILYQYHFDLSDLDLEQLQPQRPGLRANLVQQLQDGIGAAKTHVIMVDKNQPDFLFQCLARILKVEQPSRTLHINRRNTDSHSRILNFLNTELGVIDLDQKQRIAHEMESMLRAENLADRIPPIELDDVQQQRLEQIWATQYRDLRERHQRGEISLYEPAG